MKKNMSATELQGYLMTLVGSNEAEARCVFQVALTEALRAADGDFNNANVQNIAVVGRRVLVDIGAEVEAAIRAV